MPTVPSLSENQLQAVCDVLGDTDRGLTGSEIGRLLARADIDDPHPGSTKRIRLYEAFAARQRQDGHASQVIACIQAAMDPVTYSSNHSLFEERRDHLNVALAFAGVEIGEDGKARRLEKRAQTITEAQERAGRLRKELRGRNVHPEVLRFCRPELLAENYFHAVLEASKSVFERVRQLTDLDADGSRLVDQAFGLGSSGVPLLAFNSLRTETERSEHNGLMNLMKGLAGAFRNPTAHEAKISWPIGEEEALDILAFVSMLHRRLDTVVRTTPSSS